MACDPTDRKLPEVGVGDRIRVLGTWASFFVSVLICQGPEMNIGVAPVAKVCVTSKPWGSLFAVSPCWKSLTYSVSDFTEAWLSSVNLPFRMMSPPAEYRNGSHSWSSLLCRLMPYWL